jgi:hypothetical protein
VMDLLMEPRNAQVKLNVSIAAYGSVDSFARLSLIQSRLFMISIFLDPSFPTLESLWSLIPDPLTSHLHPTKLTRHGIARLQSRERPSQALWADPHGSRGFRRVADSFGTENCTRYLQSTSSHFFLDTPSQCPSSRSADISSMSATASQCDTRFSPRPMERDSDGNAARRGRIYAYGLSTTRRT